MASVAGASSASSDASAPPNIPLVIFAASAGTMIEWYDFYIFGSLTAVIAGKFFTNTDPNKDILLWLATFATGFLVRPFGALVFGRIGDMIGRKYTFLVTMTIMGLSTAAIGILPTAASIGILAPIILLVLRLLEGLALGGEYGGAATYIAEHAPDGKRGYYTSFIQITATAGLLLSLVVILVTRQVLGTAAFADWGWRIPFLLSLVLVIISLYIRVSLRESPLFSKLKAAGKTSKNPIAESFGNRYNRVMVLRVLFGATAGQAVVWYTGQFYALFFLQNVLKLDLTTSYIIVAVALLVATPFFVVVGRLSDQIGRKNIILFGCLIAALTYIPIYMAMKSFGPYLDPTVIKAPFPAPDNPNYSVVALMVLVFIQVFYVTIVYGPIAAYLVELFPTKIRYTSMSLPYHLGNGWFGGLTPVIATFLVTLFAPTATTPSPFGENYIYVGLAFPIIVALMTVVVGWFYLKDTKNVDISADPDISTGMSSAMVSGDK
ncbi:MAG: MFS transporter [Chloroflexota bacterium]